MLNANRDSQPLEEGRADTMLVTTITISYIIVSLVSAVIFYCACAVSTRDEQDLERETKLDQSDLDFQFNHLEWAEKGNI